MPQLAMQVVGAGVEVGVAAGVAGAGVVGLCPGEGVGVEGVGEVEGAGGWVESHPEGTAGRNSRQP